MNTRKKITVGILGGGPSSEHVVSLATARNVHRAIDHAKFTPTLLTFTKNRELFAGKKKLVFPSDLKQFDIIFNALHGTFGEDGQIQKILDRIRVPYTGALAKASALGMDKWKSRRAFLRAGLHVPRAILIKKMPRSSLYFSFPLVLKPRNGGSSVGVSIVSTQSELLRSLPKILKTDDVLIEEYIRGRELTCAVLEKNGKLITLPVIEIRPKPKYAFFDYEAKYKSGASEELVPAPIPRALAKKVERATLAAHRAIGASVYSRSDFIARNGDFYILEINTLPGLTANSLLPKAAQAAGISFTKLITLIINASFHVKKILTVSQRRLK